MPLLTARISSKGYCAASENRRPAERGPSNAPAAIPERKSRRVSLGQRHLLGILFIPHKTGVELLRLIASRGRRRLCSQAAVNLELFFRLFLVPRPAQRCCKRVVDRRIPGHQALGGLQGSDRLIIAFHAHKARAPPKKSVSEIRIELGSLRETRDGLIPVFVFSRHLAQDVCRTRVVGVDFEFLQKLLFRALR